MGTFNNQSLYTDWFVHGMLPLEIAHFGYHRNGLYMTVFGQSETKALAPIAWGLGWHNEYYVPKNKVVLNTQVVLEYSNAGPFHGGTIEHEIAESITDPDGNGYKGYFNGDLDEIADVCESDRKILNYAGAQWFIQKLWSNKKHSCVY